LKHLRLTEVGIPTSPAIYNINITRAREPKHPIHASITKQIEPMYKTINTLLTAIVPDLADLHAERYQRQISGGIQEYMEAVLFQYYLEHEQLMSYEDASKCLPDGIMLTFSDYVLGLFDTTGEMMRFAVTYMATNQRLPGMEKEGSNILTDLQDIRSALEMMNVTGSYQLGKEFEKKLSVTRQSVEKVEKGYYSMIVRGKERPPGWRPDMDGPKEREQIESC
jgi:predicted translin family RNA/ssDNA-binding protein